MSIKKSKLEAYLLAFLFLYLVIYFYLFLEKYTLWGSDIFFLHNLSKDIDFDSLFSDERGYPLGFPILLRMEIEASGLYPYTLIKIHIGIIYFLLILNTFLVSYKIFRDKLLSTISSILVASVYPIATLMTPQYGQTINVCLVLFFNILLFLILFEKTKRLSFLILMASFILAISITHRPSLVIVISILILYFLVIAFKTFYFRNNKNLKIIFVLVLIILIIIFIITTLNGKMIEKYYSKILLSRDKVERDMVLPYSMGYFMNSCGWELLPFIFFSTIVIYRERHRISLPFITSLIVVFGIAILYVFGIVFIGLSVSWRASNYSIYMGSILTGLAITELLKRRHERLFIIILYILVIASLVLFTLNIPIQKYFYRALTKEMPENTRPLPIFREMPALVYISIAIVAVIFGTIIYFAFKSNNARHLKNIKNINYVTILLIVMLLLPRVAVSAGYFYVLSPEIDKETHQTFKYLECTVDENISLLSDPMTLYYAVQYGFKVSWRYGGYVMKDMLPLYGPTPQGARVSAWAKVLDKVIRNEDVENLSKMMITSGTKYFIVNVDHGELVDLRKNPPYGGYSSAPYVLLKFKERLDEEKGFLLIYSRNNIYIYLLVKHYK